jgi:hypothetical protein
VQIAGIEGPGGKEFRKENLLDIRQHHHGRKRHRPRIKRAQRAEEKIEPAEVPPDVALTLELHRLVAPAVAPELAELGGILRAAKKHIVVVAITAQQFIEQ